MRYNLEGMLVHWIYLTPPSFSFNLFSFLLQFSFLFLHFLNIYICLWLMMLSSYQFIRLNPLSTLLTNLVPKDPSYRHACNTHGQDLSSLQIVWQSVSYLKQRQTWSARQCCSLLWIMGSNLPIVEEIFLLHQLPGFVTILVKQEVIFGKRCKQQEVIKQKNAVDPKFILHNRMLKYYIRKKISWKHLTYCSLKSLKG